MVPWSSGEDAWLTSRKAMVRVHPGSLRFGDECTKGGEAASHAAWMGSIPIVSTHTSMVKRTSSLATNERFQVRVLVGVLPRPSAAASKQLAFLHFLWP